MNSENRHFLAPDEGEMSTQRHTKLIRDRCSHIKLVYVIVYCDEAASPPLQKDISQ